MCGILGSVVLLYGTTNGTPQSCLTTFEAQRTTNTSMTSHPAHQNHSETMILSTLLNLFTLFSNGLLEFSAFSNSLEIRLRFAFIFFWHYSSEPDGGMRKHHKSPLSCLYVVSSLMSGTWASDLIHMFFVLGTWRESPLYWGNLPHGNLSGTFYVSLDKLSCNHRNVKGEFSRTPKSVFGKKTRGSVAVQWHYWMHP